MDPSKIIGTVDTREFVVASFASLGLLLALSLSEIPFGVVGALLVGGLVAAPIAACLVRVFPMRILGMAVGGVTLIRRSVPSWEPLAVSGGFAILIYALIVALWVAALAFSI